MTLHVPLTSLSPVSVSFPLDPSHLSGSAFSVPSSIPPYPPQLQGPTDFLSSQAVSPIRFSDRSQLPYWKWEALIQSAPSSSLFLPSLPLALFAVLVSTKYTLGSNLSWKRPLYLQSTCCIFQSFLIITATILGTQSPSISLFTSGHAHISLSVFSTSISRCIMCLFVHLFFAPMKHRLCKVGALGLCMFTFSFH